MAREQHSRHVIFVCGSARSGSTLVDLVLGNDPRGFSLGEIASWFRPTRSHHFDIKCGCGVYPCPVWERLMKVRESEFYPALFRDLDIDFAVDSSKRLPWVIDQNRRLRKTPGFRVDNLFLYKQPIALAYSYWKRGDDPIANVQRSFSYYEEAMRARLPMITLDHDALVTDPDRILTLLCSWLGIEMRADKLKFWNKTHHHVFGSFGPRRQLFDGQPSIYVERWSEAFDVVRPGLEANLRADAKVMRTLEVLQQHDLRNCASPQGHGAQVSIRRPRFYWEQKLRDLKLRHWPRHHPDKEASLIRDWKF